MAPGTGWLERETQPQLSAPGEPAAQPKVRGAVGTWVANLDAGSFACVMASGIVSVGAELLGQHVLSDVALVVTVVAFVVLGAAYVSRAVFFPTELRQALRDPSIAMGHFTLVAGVSVLAVRLLMAGHPLVSLVLGAFAGLLWLVLSYGLPWSIMIAARRPVLGDINGTWLIWVVATQSIAVVAAGLAASSPWRSWHEHLAVVAVVLWGAGSMLYVTLIVIIFLRLFLVEITPKEMGPAYWIAMGATAISVRAAAGILGIGDRTAASLLSVMHPVLVGVSVIFWAFGTWWIPMLVLFGVWRYLVRGYPMAYEPRLWSVVFPLGMYTVASETLGTTPGLGFMTQVARLWQWVDVAAWGAVLLLLVAAFTRNRVARRLSAGARPRPAR